LTGIEFHVISCIPSIFHRLEFVSTAVSGLREDCGLSREHFAITKMEGSDSGSASQAAAAAATGAGAAGGNRRRAARKQRHTGRREVDIVFPREEAYLDELGGKKDDDDGAEQPAAGDAAATIIDQPDLVMKQLKFLNVLVTTASVKKRVWIWRKIVPGIVLKKAEWNKEGSRTLTIALLLHFQASRSVALHLWSAVAPFWLHFLLLQI
jgi:hypothetical protein